MDCTRRDSFAAGLYIQADVVDHMVVVAVVVLLPDPPFAMTSEPLVAKLPWAVQYPCCIRQQNFHFAAGEEEAHHRDCCVDSEVQTCCAMSLCSTEMRQATTCGKEQSAFSDRYREPRVGGGRPTWRANQRLWTGPKYMYGTYVPVSRQCLHTTRPTMTRWIRLVRGVTQFPVFLYSPTSFCVKLSPRVTRDPPYRWMSSVNNLPALSTSSFFDVPSMSAHCSTSRWPSASPFPITFPP